MKISYWLPYVLVVMMMIVNWRLWVQNEEVKKSNISKLSVADERLKLLSNEKQIILNGNMFYLQNELEDLNNSCVFSGHDTLNSFNILDRKNEPKLVFRFSGNTCNLCVDFGINKLKQHFDDYTINNRVILLGTDLNPRVRETYYDKNVLSFCDRRSTIGLDLEQHQIPFFFLFDKDEKSKMVFVPDKAVPEMTDAYLMSVKKRFLTNK